MEGEVDVYATTPDGAAADTARVLIGAVPVGVGIFPGFDGIGVDGTKQFNGAVVDALGNPIDGQGPIENDGFAPIEKVAPGVIWRKSVSQPACFTARAAGLTRFLK